MSLCLCLCVCHYVHKCKPYSHEAMDAYIFLPPILFLELSVMAARYLLHRITSMLNCGKPSQKPWHNIVRIFLQISIINTAPIADLFTYPCMKCQQKMLFRLTLKHPSPQNKDLPQLLMNVCRPSLQVRSFTVFFSFLLFFPHVLPLYMKGIMRGYKQFLFWVADGPCYNGVGFQKHRLVIDTSCRDFYANFIVSSAFDAFVEGEMEPCAYHDLITSDAGEQG